MQYDFDKIHERTQTNSIKWDFIYENGVFHQREGGVDPLASNALLPLWLADMDFPTSRPVIDALVKRAQHGIFGYTMPAESYYEAIVGWMRQRHGWKVERDWILTTAGVMPTISMLIQTFTEPDDKVIIQTPVFHPFYQAIEDNGRVIARNPLRYEAGRYWMDFDDLEEKSTDPRAKMIILCSPHNPVGRVWTRKELQCLGDICQRNDLLIVSDEIHNDLVYSWATFTTFGAVDEAFNDRLILCNGPSKTFNMPGLKTSITFIPSETLRQQFLVTLRKLNQLFGVSTFGALALQTAYEQGEEWLEQLLAYLEANCVFLQAYVAQHLPQLCVIHPEALYLIWIDCRALGLDPQGLKRLLYNEANVYLEQGSTYGPEGDGFVRINIACPRTILEMALARIQVAVDRLKRGGAKVAL
jgi:cystathionine beta-lyase